MCYNKLITNDSEPISTPEISGAEFAYDMGQLFEREHRLPLEIKPIDNLESVHDFKSGYMGGTSDPILSKFQRPEPIPEPTLDEKIKHRGDDVWSEKFKERRYDKIHRSRINFGTEFHIAVSFGLTPPKFVSGSALTDAEVGIGNRSYLYQYLQHRGMILIDDTGRDSYRGARTTRGTGHLMLPEEIEHPDFFKLEDEVRKHYPFTYQEVDLVRLLQEKARQEQSPPEDFASDPRSMMELVDRLSMDERFAPLFEVARKISKARSEKPRASMEDEVATPPRRTQDTSHVDDIAGLGIKEYISVPPLKTQDNLSLGLGNTTKNIKPLELSMADYDEVMRISRKLFPDKLDSED